MRDAIRIIQPKVGKLSSLLAKYAIKYKELGGIILSYMKVKDLKLRS